jgi:hypothetical protein
MRVGPKACQPSILRSLERPNEGFGYGALNQKFDADMVADLRMNLPATRCNTKLLSIG